MFKIKFSYLTTTIIQISSYLTTLKLPFLLSHHTALFNTHYYSLTFSYFSHFKLSTPTTQPPTPSPHISQVGVPDHMAKILTYPEMVTPRNKERMMELVLNGVDMHPGANRVVKKNGIVWVWGEKGSGCGFEGKWRFCEFDGGGILKWGVNIRSRNVSGWVLVVRLEFFIFIEKQFV